MVRDLGPSDRDLQMESEAWDVNTDDAWAEAVRWGNTCFDFILFLASYPHA